MLTIENFPKINNSAIKNGWWVSICRCHQDYYSFKLIQKDANNRVCDSFSVLLSRESIWMDEIKKNAYRFVVNKQKTDMAVTLDYIQDSVNMRRALGGIIDHRHKWGF